MKAQSKLGPEITLENSAPYPMVLFKFLRFQEINFKPFSWHVAKGLAILD